MAQFFLSYARSAEDLVGALVGDIEALGHSLWYDNDLNGGQSWWAKILEKIEAADVFLIALDPGAIASVACRREFRYARALGVPIVPILLSDEVNIATLRPELAELNIVDYRNRDAGAALRLARTLAQLPPRPALPDPMPEKPPVPLSYLSTLVAKIRSEQELSENDQAVLMAELMAGLEKEDVGAEIPALAEEFLQRREIRAHIAAATRLALRAVQPVPPTPDPEPEPEPVVKDVPRERFEAAEPAAVFAPHPGAATMAQTPQNPATAPPSRTWRRRLVLGAGVLLWSAAVSILPLMLAADYLRSQNDAKTGSYFYFPNEEVTLLFALNVVCLGLATFLLGRRKRRGPLDLRTWTLVAFFIGIAVPFGIANLVSEDLAMPMERVYRGLEDAVGRLGLVGNVFVILGIIMPFWPPIAAVCVATIGRVLGR